MNHNPHPPGPELDAIVATGVMGWKKRDRAYPYDAEWLDDTGGIHACFQPSISHDSAELVKAKLVEMGWELTITYSSDGVRASAFKLRGTTSPVFHAPKEPHAVALLAKAVHEWEQQQ